MIEYIHLYYIFYCYIFTNSIHVAYSDIIYWRIAFHLYNFIAASMHNHRDKILQKRRRDHLERILQNERKNLYQRQ